MAHEEIVLAATVGASAGAVSRARNFQQIEIFASFDQLVHDLDRRSGIDVGIKFSINEHQIAAQILGMSSLISFALQAEARLLLLAKNFPAAREKMDEASQIIEAGPMHDLPRAYALILRGHYFVAVGEPDLADVPLAAAWQLLEPWAEMFYAAGWQGALAGWWTVTARLRGSHGDREGDVLSWRQALERRRVVSCLPQLEGPYKHNALAVALWDFGQFQEEIGDPLATESLAESRSLRQSIGLPPLAERGA